MNSIQKITFLFLILTCNCSIAQELKKKEVYGNALNAGAGLGYYRYVGYPVQTVHVDYELQIDADITVAPFINMYAYSGTYFWGDLNNETRIYDYSETVIPIGLKVSYYFDKLLKAGPNWDFYSSGSLGFVFRKTTWEPAYTGKNQIDPGMGPLYLDLHIGSEFHLTKVFGFQLDLSAGMTTLGLCIHLP